MNNKPVLPYYNLKQVCEKLSLDLSQLQSVIKKHKGRIWICIKSKDVAYETKTNSLTDDEYFKISNLSVEELKKEGWTITPLETNFFLAEKGNSFCKILCGNNVIIAIQKPLLLIRKEKLNHDGYVELPEDSPIREHLNNENLEMSVIIIKSQKEDYTDILEPVCPIKFADVYIHNDEVERLEKLTQGASSPKKSSQTYRESAISIAVINSVLPILLPDKNSLLSKNERNTLIWNCWSALKEALEKNGLSVAKHDLKRTKDLCEIKGNSDIEDVFTNFKNFRTRFPKWLSAYLLNKI